MKTYKRDSLKTYKVLVRFCFFFGTDSVPITTRREGRDIIETRKLANWKEIIQKFLNRHWPDKIFFDLFPHHGVQFIAIFLISGKGACGRELDLDWSGLGIW